MGKKTPHARFKHASHCQWQLTADGADQMDPQLLVLLPRAYVLKPAWYIGGSHQFLTKLLL